ncbi:hypothetical protein AWB76_05177 [Caballeronia temeraria]|uniref:HEAT repeat protein n=1 Tax=Caballeronia temeraria TaxID=1777137 RepID=A0A158C6G2_9BURK|nr:hypothetical protein [Caballeronia temeraria]SAK77935.1 hypothetical protein AWB76_05177 [Caballeronia temeraria]
MRTALALTDVPACLGLAATWVGPPREHARETRAPLSVRGPVRDADDIARFRRHAARECFDTASALRVHREPLADERWQLPARAEQRLLAQINAIVALGPDALALVIRLALDPDLADPGRVFAALLTLGTVDDPALHTQALGIFRRAVMRSAPEARAAVEALGVCPHPGFDDALAPWLCDPQARIREACVRVLAFRGTLAEAAWHAALRDPDLGVSTAALGAPLAGYEPRACEEALQPCFDMLHAETRVRLALRAGVSIGAARAHDFASWCMRGDAPGWADAAHCVALFGRAADAPAIARLLQGADPRAGIRAAARLGVVDLVPDLLSVLARHAADSEAAIGARRSIQTITGIACDASDARDAKANARETASLWEQRASHFRYGVRYRDGRALSLALLLELLRDGPGSREERDTLYLEMRAATASRVPRFSVHDFVGVQRQALRCIGAWLRERS